MLCTWLCLHNTYWAGSPDRHPPLLTCPAPTACSAQPRDGGAGQVPRAAGALAGGFPRGPEARAAHGAGGTLQAEPQDTGGWNLWWCEVGCGCHPEACCRMPAWCIWALAKALLWLESLNISWLTLPLDRCLRHCCRWCLPARCAARRRAAPQLPQPPQLRTLAGATAMERRRMRRVGAA